MDEAPHKGPESEVQARRKFPRLSRYVLGQLLGPVALLTLLMTCVIWLTYFPRLLDMVINRGQSAVTFIYLTSLYLPTVAVIILPIAFFFGALLTLSRLNSESELVVMASAGFSQSQLAGPVFIAAGIVMLITWTCALWLMPLGQRTAADKELDISADIGAALLSAGEFTFPAKGLTVFIRQIGSNGQIGGILVHDNRDTKRPVTYIAQKGVLAQTLGGSRLIMYDGTVEETANGGAQLSVLSFKSDSLDLDQFAGPARFTLRRTKERYLGELLNPKEKEGVTQQIRNAWAAEAHDRLSQPLYCLAFGMIALAAILRGRRQRGALAMRLTAAALAAALLRIAGYGVAGPASSHPALFPLFYLIPLIGMGLALAVLTGKNPGTFFARRNTADAAA
jgi:lipopolysaccharide export system permease protein